MGYHTHQLILQLVVCKNVVNIPLAFLNNADIQHYLHFYWLHVDNLLFNGLPELNFQANINVLNKYHLFQK